MYTGKGKPPTKLMPIRKGPMKVLEQEKDAYTVLDIVSRRTQVVHVSRLYPFFYDDTRVDPKEHRSSELGRICRGIYLG